MKDATTAEKKDTKMTSGMQTLRAEEFLSLPDKFLVLSSLSIVAAAPIIPLTPLGDWFQFTRPSVNFYLFLAEVIAAYLIMVELLRRWFYKRHDYRIDRTLA